MIKQRPRMARERETVEHMIQIYCTQRHGTGEGLCSGCEALWEYARQRLENCPFQEGKTTCAKCRVHCYRPDARQDIRAVMRYAGPRILCRHPGLALWHVIDGLRQEPVRLENKRGASMRAAADASKENKS